MALLQTAYETCRLVIDILAPPDFADEGDVTAFLHMSKLPTQVSRLVCEDEVSGLAVTELYIICQYWVQPEIAVFARYVECRPAELGTRDKCRVNLTRPVALLLNIV